MQTRNKSPYENRIEAEKKRRRRIRNIVLVLVLVIAVAAVIFLLNRTGTTTELSAIRLTCYADQNVTPFGTNVIYHDGASLHCLAGNGAIKWSYPAGQDCYFHASDNYIVIWQGEDIAVVDSSGRCTYKETLSSPVQFARISDHYVAICVGEDTKPDLMVKDVHGTQVDEETEAFSSLLMLDAGFYGDNDQYMWTLCLDVYSTAINTMMNTFQVGKMNTGEVSIGDKLAYKVMYDNANLHVFTTQQMYTYDYKAVINSTATKLIYGWRYLDSCPRRNRESYILLSPTNLQSGVSQSYAELRLLNGSNDRRFNLPTECVGAIVQGRSIYAISGNYLYRVDIDSNRTYAYADPLPDGNVADAFLGKTSDGKALVSAGSSVYIVTLPD